MYRISKIIEYEVELLPDVVETAIWKDFNDGCCSKRIEFLFCLYIAIAKRENYFQLNSPTAFGNSEYNYLCGLVAGLLQASGYEEVKVEDQIIVKNSKRKVLVIDKVKRPQAYYDNCKENDEMLKGFIGG